MKKNESHTPGPWRLNRGDQCTVEWVDPENPDDPLVVAKTYTSPFAPAREIARANARLIAAAPRLLALALSLQDWIEEDTLVDLDEISDEVKDLHGETIAAITDATGERPKSRYRPATGEPA